MTTSITLAGPDALDRVLALLERRETEAGGPEWDAAERDLRSGLVAPLLAGGPEGAVWLIGPVRAPLGLAVVTFGWSLRGGREAWLEELFIRPSVRRRGIGREVVHGVAVSLRSGGMRRFHARLATEARAARTFLAACGFSDESGTILMTDPF